jgi:hypothetical protein
MNEEERPELSIVLGTILQMMQHFTNVINQEALKILHNAKYCGDYVDVCPICLGEEE